MISNWARYREEQAGVKCLEHEWGFISYMVLPDSVYIEDLWVRPEDRRSGRALGLVRQVEQIALELGRKVVLAKVDLTNKTCALIMAAALAAAYFPFRADAGMVWFKKELGNGI